LDDSLDRENIQRTAPVDDMTLKVLLKAKKRPQYTNVVQGGVEICVREDFSDPALPQRPSAVYRIRLTMSWEIAWLLVSQMYQRQWTREEILRDVVPYVTYEYTENGRRDLWTGAGPYRTPQDLAEHAIFLIQCDIEKGWGQHFEPHYRQWLVSRVLASPLKRISDDPDMDFEPIL
jgi:hypothetical protein